MSDQLMMQVADRLVELLEQIDPFLCDFDVHNASVSGTAFSMNQFLLLQPIQQSGHCRDNLDHPVSDFEAWQRFPFTPQNAEHVVLRRSQSKLAKQPSEPILKLIVGPQEIQDRLLLQRIERVLLFQLTAQFAVCHGTYRNYDQQGLTDMEIVYMSCIVLSSDPASAFFEQAVGDQQEVTDRKE